MKALILTDGKAGHENQSKALARALGVEFDIVEVHFKSRLHKAASYLLDRFGIGCVGLYSRDIAGLSGYGQVIGTGSGVFYAVKSLAHRIGAKCAVVLYPRGYRLSNFDCIVAPAFDQPVRADNVVEIPANLVANDKSFYASGVEEYFKRSQIRPDVGVIIGGPNKCSTMSVAWMKRELDRIFTERGVKAVTTSRRTPPEVEALVDSYPWDYKLLYSKDHFNPIPAFVDISRKLYVTAESTGMISEACTFGSAQVEIMDNLNPGRHKFRRFVDNLRQGGFIGGARKIDLTDQLVRIRALLGI